MILKAEAVCRQFMREAKGTNVFTAVEPTDFTLPAGQLSVLTGRSGSGKSTFLNMLSGLLVPTSGIVTFDGKDIYQMEDGELSKLRNQYFGYIPQGQSALASLTVMENILLPCTLYGEVTDEREYAMELLRQMDIESLADAMPSELSGGEMRRMAIARAMIRRPAVVFADEPTGDLDDENTQVVFEMLKTVAADGAAVLLVTHEDDAGQYADQMYRMTKGVLQRVEGLDYRSA